jgi:hypothetical protein
MTGCHSNVLRLCCQMSRRAPRRRSARRMGSEGCLRTFRRSGPATQPETPAGGHVDGVPTRAGRADVDGRDVPAIPRTSAERGRQALTASCRPPSMANRRLTPSAFPNDTLRANVPSVRMSVRMAELASTQSRLLDALAGRPSPSTPTRRSVHRRSGGRMRQTKAGPRIPGPRCSY